GRPTVRGRRGAVAPWVGLGDGRESARGNLATSDGRRTGGPGYRRRGGRLVGRRTLGRGGSPADNLRDGRPGPSAGAHSRPAATNGGAAGRRERRAERG